jgi:hypothetical protein
MGCACGQVRETKNARKILVNNLLEKGHFEDGADWRIILT